MSIVALQSLFNKYNIRSSLAKLPTYSIISVHDGCRHMYASHFSAPLVFPSSFVEIQIYILCPVFYSLSRWSVKDFFYNVGRG